MERVPGGTAGVLGSVLGTRPSPCRWDGALLAGSVCPRSWVTARRFLTYAHFNLCSNLYLAKAFLIYWPFAFHFPLFLSPVCSLPLLLKTAAYLFLTVSWGLLCDSCINLFLCILACPHPQASFYFNFVSGRFCFISKHILICYVLASINLFLIFFPIFTAHLERTFTPVFLYFSLSIFFSCLYDFFLFLISIKYLTHLEFIWV